MRTAVFVFALFLAQPLFAQSVYLPLESGNEWVYYTLIDPPGEPYDTLGAGTFVVEGTVESGGGTYWVFPHPEAFTDTIRVDADGRVWGRWMGEEHLYFDFAAEDGATYSFPSGAGENEYEVTVRRDQTAETRPGTFEDAIRFDFDIPSALDDERSFVFAPDVGLVYTVGGMGEPRWLYSATIGGRSIPTLVERPGPDEVSLDAFPNPARGDVNLRLNVPASAHATVTVYDAIGRRVHAVADRRFAAGQHNLGWMPNGLAAGTYVVAVTAGEQRVVRMITLTR